MCISTGLYFHINTHMRTIVGMCRGINVNISISVMHIRTCLNISATININTGINVSIQQIINFRIRRSINTYKNNDVSINTGIFINNSISIDTNTHTMICIRRNICTSITLEFRIRIEISINNISMNISSNIIMSTSVHRSISIQLSFNNGIIVCIKAEADWHKDAPKTKKTKN